MKKYLTNRAFRQSLLSAIVLGFFILVAANTIDDIMKREITVLDNGLVQEFRTWMGDEYVTTGARDDNGIWQGPVEISKRNTASGSGSLEVERVSMLDGERHGESITTYSVEGYKKIHRIRYNMGNVVKSTTKTIKSSNADISAFQVLGNKYPWFLLSLNVFGFDTAYVQAYMTTVETKISSSVFDITNFDKYYGDVVDELQDTPYDSIITLNSQLTMFQGLDEMKNSEFRLAIIDHYRTAGSTTFNIISTTYPGYLLNLNKLGASNEDFKVFCQDMDSRMTGYGSLNLQDPFFIDSVDARMFRAILAISNAGKSSSLSAEPSVNNMLLNYKNYDINDIYDEVIKMLKPSFSKSTPKEVATIVVNDMLWQYYIPAEIIRQAVMEAYFIKGGVKRVPIATTVFESNSSATSATLTGYVIEDGGAAVTSRGIAWATFYNPTNSNNPVPSGTGTGNFNVTLNGLTPGTTYFARTFATNSAGTAYGNTVSFVASVATDVNDVEILDNNFTIYPNPASSLTTLRFQLEDPEDIMLTIIDMKGKVVLTKELGGLSQGENQVMFNLSVLQNGMYICQLTKGTTKVTQKLVISR
jgi:hypothetical protein